VVPEQATLIVEGDQESAKAIVTMLDSFGVTAQASGRRNLDGAAITSWLVVAGLAVKAAPDILRALAELVKELRLGSVTVDLKTQKIKIDRPGAEQIRELIEKLGDNSPDDDA
jgi:hypothetical protein